MTINERVNLFIKEVKTNPSALAKKLGLSSAAIKKLVDGGSQPSSKILRPLLELYPTLNMNWILIEQGEMFLDDTFTTAERIEQRDTIIDILKGSVKNLEMTVELQRKTIEERDITIIALQEKIA